MLENDYLPYSTHSQSCIAIYALPVRRMVCLFTSRLGCGTIVVYDTDSRP